MTKKINITTGPDACGLGKSLFRGSQVCFVTDDGKIIKDIISCLKWDRNKDDRYNFCIEGYAKIIKGEYNVKTNKGTLEINEIS